MPSFSTPIDPSNRLIVPAFIGDASQLPAPDQIESQLQDGQTPPEQKVDLAQFKGLIDTGAQITCVTERLAEQLQLPPIGTRPIASIAAGQTETNIYRLLVMIAISVPHKENKEQEKETYQAVPMSQPAIIEAGEFINPDDDVDVLIGMDVISTSVLIISGHDKRLTMSF